MITVKNLLLELARSLDQGSPQNGDSDIDIPSVITPIIQLASPLDAPNIGSVSGVQRSTFHVSLFQSIAAGVPAGSNSQLATLGKGLWKFNVMLSVSSNYQQNTLFSCSVQLIFAGGTVYLAGVTPSGVVAAPVTDTVVRDMEILIPVDGATLFMNSATNAAGNQLNASMDMMCWKLL